MVRTAVRNPSAAEDGSTGDLGVPGRRREGPPGGKHSRRAPSARWPLDNGRYLPAARVDGPREEQVEKFLTEHNVEAQKFVTFDEAEALFTKAGFAIERKLVPMRDPALVRQTWILAAR